MFVMSCWSVGAWCIAVRMCRPERGAHQRKSRRKILQKFSSGTFLL